MLRNSYFNVATIRQQYSSRGLKVINKSAVGFSRGPKLAFMLKTLVPQECDLPRFASRTQDDGSCLQTPA